MQSNLSNLGQTLKSLPKPTAFPMALPPVHLTRASWFSSIVDKGQLEPLPDNVFNEEILYFFYGGVFYRTANKSTRDMMELPVAFLFDPSVLASFACYYPFDTGGLARGLFGDWGTRLDSFKETFMVNGGDHTIPSQMVHYFYGSNENYLMGKVDPDLKNKPDPMPLLFDFFSDDLSSKGVDHRQYIIECQAHLPVPLNKGLLWVGFPDYYTGEFERLIKLLEPSVPAYDKYDSHIIFNPTEIAAQLEMTAREHVKRFVAPPKARGI